MFYCKLCVLTREKFKFSIHIDECIVAMDKNGKTQWFKSIMGETRSGLVGAFKHNAQINIIGGISRKGATKLVIYSGNTCADGFKILAREFLLRFIDIYYPRHHRLHMDNAPFHVSTKNLRWMTANRLNHFKRLRRVQI